jgi:hypothetical protein
MGSNEGRKKSILSVFSTNGGKGTVHPQNGDIEAGGSRRVNFSKKYEGPENSAMKMVRYNSSPVYTDVGFEEKIGRFSTAEVLFSRTHIHRHLGKRFELSTRTETAIYKKKK